MAIEGVPAMRSFGPVTVAPEHYFMMGDNRDNSFDSRYFGTVARDQIVGRATALQDAVRNTTIPKKREASWTAPALWRFAIR